eukprot:m.89305 g.89305  ORF g.89305 m.89305 type:complete len:87 (+) comp11731_c0_seq2:1532-1792(+)
MKLEYTEDRESSIGKNVTFRMHMLGPYLEEPGCFTFSESGENACPTSCMMRMGRSDMNFLTFVIPTGSAVATMMRSAGLATYCHRV